MLLVTLFMKIVTISNFFNHHQKPISDELYKLTNGNYWFICTSQLPEERKLLGYAELRAPYVIETDNSIDRDKEILDIIEQADVVLFGDAPYKYVKSKIKKGGLILRISERIYKKPPSILKKIYHHFLFRKKLDRFDNSYILCASAFTKKDFESIHCFRDRMYKWGYFPIFKEIDIVENLNRLRVSPVIKLMWVGRFLDWKHPELPVLLAQKLREHNIPVELDMFGTGPEVENISRLIQDLSLDDIVNLKGSLSNPRILQQMQTHHILLFTSDRYEGWGAVANEAMSNGILLIASDQIGAIPYLIKDGENGIIYEDKNINSLFHKTLNIINRHELREKLVLNAYNSIKELWNPHNAANSLIKLVQNLKKENSKCIMSGPGSKA